MNEEKKDLEYWKNNCEEDYITTPISVLRYIGELEKAINKNSVIPDVIETSPNFPVLQDDSIEEKCCNNCKHNGNQMIYPSACTGCSAEEEYNNHEYSR